MESNFALWVVKSVIDSIEQKTWRRQPRYPFAAAVFSAGVGAFDAGVCLGHALRGHREQLWALLGEDVHKATGYHKSGAANFIKATPPDQFSGLTFYVQPVLERRGLSLDNQGSLSLVNETFIDSDELASLIADAWGRGLAYSLEDENFASCFNRQYSGIGTEALMAGDQIQGEYDPSMLEERTDTILRAALLWAEKTLDVGLIKLLGEVLGKRTRDYDEDTEEDALSAAPETSFNSYRKFVQQEPNSRDAVSTILACSFVGSKCAKYYVKTVPGFGVNIYDIDANQSARILFVWTAFILGILHLEQLDAYPNMGWERSFPEGENLPAKIAKGIADQFVDSDEFQEREGRSSVMEWVLAHWLTAYAINPASVELPAMPLSSREIVQSSISPPSPAQLIALASAAREIADDIGAVKQSYEAKL